MKRITSYCRSVLCSGMLLAMPCKGLAQDPGTEFTYPTIIFEAPSWHGFVPAGWEVLQYAEGDLNEDKAKDYAVILQYKEPVHFTDANHRKIWGKPRLLFMVTQARPRSFYRLVEQSNSFVLTQTEQMPTDPFRGMRLERGFLFFDFLLLNQQSKEYDVSATYTFRFEMARFYLLGVNYYSLKKKSGQYDSYNFHFLNSKVSIRKGNEEEGDDWVQSKLLPRMMLKHFGSFPAPFTWEIMSGVKI